MKQVICILALCTGAPALAEGTRQLDAHEHGVSALNIAIEGTSVTMELFAPGADIVGFEYAATSDADLAKINDAVARLGKPLDLFAMPSAASCTVNTAQAMLESEDEHQHDAARHDDHDHDDHAHDDHGHNDHAHDDHGHEDEADANGHTEFQAVYTLTCENPEQLTGITFAYFETFPNAQEVEVQVVTASGAQAFEVERDAPVLDLEP